MIAFSSLPEVLEMVLEAMQAFKKKLDEEKDDAKLAMLTKILHRADTAERKLGEVMHGANKSPQLLEEAKQVRNLPIPVIGSYSFLHYV